MEPLRVAVVGVGHLGKNHARIYSAMPGVRLECVVDSDKKRAADIAAAYGCRYFCSIEEMPEVDAASIAVPTTEHYSIGIKLLNKGVNLLIEKPISHSLQQAQELCSLAETKGLVLQVGHVERYNPAITSLENIVQSPRFVEMHRLAPFKARGHDVGVVLDLMIHDIDVLFSLVKAQVESIDAVGVCVLNQTEDIANARVRFDNGCVANLTASRVSREEMRKVRIFQKDSYISLDYKLQEGYVYKKSGTEITREALPVEKDEPLKVELESFAGCVGRNAAPKVSGHHATRALETALLITRRIKESGA